MLKVMEVHSKNFDWHGMWVFITFHLKNIFDRNTLQLIDTWRAFQNKNANNNKTHNGKEKKSTFKQFLLDIVLTQGKMK